MRSRSPRLQLEQAWRLDVESDLCRRDDGDNLGRNDVDLQPRKLSQLMPAISWFDWGSRVSFLSMRAVAQPSNKSKLGEQGDPTK